MMSEEDDEVEGLRRILPMKQINISIQLSFNDIVLLCMIMFAFNDIVLFSVDVLCMIECLH